MVIFGSMLRVGGVPEHFNEPWHDAIAKDGSITWKSYPGGTGAMCESLSKNEIDCALLLTEGAVKYCLEKKDVLLCGVYVSSPLLWGVHVGSGSSFNNLKDIASEKEVVFAISRFGSGSHLMAFVCAKQMGWSKLKFEVVGNLKGAQEYLAKHPNTLFMWEKAMTDPLVKRGEFKRVGEVPTPWPCFVLAVRKDGVNLQKLNQVLSQVSIACNDFKSNRSKSIERVVSKFGIEKHLVEEWFSRLSFASSLNTFDEKGISMLQNVRDTLVELGQLPPSYSKVDIRSIILRDSLRTARL